MPAAPPSPGASSTSIRPTASAPASSRSTAAACSGRPATAPTSRRNWRAFGAGGATFDTNGNNVTLASSLSGVGGLTKTGDRHDDAAGVNTYQGGTTINSGTLRAARCQSRRGRGRSPSAAARCSSCRAFQQPRGHAQRRRGHIDTNGNNAMLTGTIDGAGGLTKIGAGTLTLDGHQHLWRRHDHQSGTLAVAPTPISARLGRPHLRWRHAAVSLGLHDRQ